MSPWLRAELRAGVCPGRLVLPDEIVAGEPVAELKRRAAGRPLRVVLSNHFVRYAVLAPSKALRTRADWLAYARHVFETTYGTPARAWDVRVSGRVAAAVDSALLAELRTIPTLRSVQPYVMAAFNARRRRLKAKSAWFVVQEPGRLALGLFRDGDWHLLRTRRIGADWSLADLLEREAVSIDAPECTRAVLCAENPVPHAGRYELLDLTPAARAHAMVLQ